jgi:uncharacterized protein
MAGLVTADYLVSHLDTEQIGHATAEELPAVTPFTDGTPRYATRLYDTPGPTILLSEVFVPVDVGERLADAVLALADEHGVEEVTVLYGVPYPHGPDDHAVFSVATDAYDTGRLAEAGVRPLVGGFLDGFVGSLVERGMDPDTPAVGTLITPAHPPGPDFEGALLLLEAVSAHYGLAVESAELQERSAEVRQYYQELASRMESMDRRDLPEDRMYM